MEGVVTADGVPPTAVEHYCTAPTSKWPSPGQDLPVLVDRADPQRMRVMWDEVMSGRERGRQAARDAAERMTNGNTPGEEPGPGASTFTTGDFSALPPEFQSLVGDIQEQAQQAMARFNTVMGGQAQARVTFDPTQVTVLGAPGRPAPGMAGGGTTPEQAAQALTEDSRMQRATAVVLAAHEVSIPIGMPGAPPAGLVDITLDIKAPDGSGYTTVTRVGFSTAERKARVTTPGTALPVLIDPTDHTRVVIDIRQIPGF